MNRTEMDVNDVVIGRNSTMPLPAFLSKYKDTISATELRAVVLESQKRYEEYVEAHRPIWQEEGALLKEVRETMGVTQKSLSDLIDISTQTLRRLEKGEPVRSRKMMKQSCQTALNLVDMQRKQLLHRLEDKVE